MFQGKRFKDAVGRLDVSITKRSADEELWREVTHDAKVNGTTT